MRNFFAAKRLLLVWLLSLVLATPACRTSVPRTAINKAAYNRPIRVACIGDSITYGHGIPDRERNCYPARLQQLLGTHWDVKNFGSNGATALKQGTKPYAALPLFEAALAFQPDAVVIELGTNDTNAKSWPAHRQDFTTDYLELLGRFEKLGTKPRIYLCLPPPLFRDRGKTYDTDKILVEEVIPRIKMIAREKNLTTIDIYADFKSDSALFPDGVHPNAQGAEIFAKAAYASLTGL